MQARCCFVAIVENSHTILTTQKHGRRRSGFVQEQESRLRWLCQSCRIETSSFGDFNYRVDATYDQAVKWINEKHYDMLLIRDQLRIENGLKNQTSGRTFPSIREAGISFPPTYKFDRGTQGLIS
jgi:hypothetical protein